MLPAFIGVVHETAVTAEIVFVVAVENVRSQLSPVETENDAAGHVTGSAACPAVLFGSQGNILSLWFLMDHILRMKFFLNAHEQL